MFLNLGHPNGKLQRLVKYWDLRAPNSVLTSETPERAKSMDFAASLLVVGMENKKIGVYDMRKPCEPLKVDTKLNALCITATLTYGGQGDQGPAPPRDSMRIRSSVWYQLRMRWYVLLSIVTTPYRSIIFAVGVDGRVAVEYADQQGYIFRAQDEAQMPVNCMAFNPVLGTLATGGADGLCNFWDVNNRRRLKRSNQASSSITSLTFNPNGTIMAFACTCDQEPRTDGQPIKVILRAVTHSEAAPLPRDI
ncbi:hypothetical protein SpCBS45565_g03461 [Spizellomyces sp. 'palustris']|nr:hypothetical protein SpCBS45565_g03461 [Spizellomyces sp. 'palustris']